MRPCARVWVALWAVATVVFGVISVALAGDRVTGLPTTYGAISTGAFVIHVVGGVAMLGAGWAARTAHPASAVGPLAVLVGVTWFAQDWAGWSGGPELLRTVGMGIEPLAMIPAALLVVMAAPTPPVPVGWRRFFAVGTFVVGLGSVVHLAVYDPLFDLECWSNCTDNSFLLHRDPEAARIVMRTVRSSSFVLGAGAVTYGLAQLVRASDVARRASAIVVLPAVAVTVTTAVFVGSLTVGLTERPDHPLFAALHRARGVTLVLLATGISIWLLEQMRTRRAVAALAESVARSSEVPLEQLLARATADPRLRIGYWIDEPPRLVDAAGSPFDAPIGRDQVATTVERNGEPIAVVVHDRAHHDRADLARELGPAVRLAIDNERLHAASLAQMEELRRSRARIVEASDRARWRIERDLHDGAQQRLLAASYATRLAASAARDAGDEELLTFCGRAVDEINECLNELRVLAHGIHPAVLTEAGLPMALRTVGLGSAIPVEIAGCPELRLDRSIEAAAYATIVDAVGLLTHHGASYATVAIASEGDELAISVGHDGAVTPTDLIDVADRVGAAGGHLEVSDNMIKARVPCAS
jgi:signal transduction histidine kinase